MPQVTASKKTEVSLLMTLETRSPPNGVNKQNRAPAEAAQNPSKERMNFQQSPFFSGVNCSLLVFFFGFLSSEGWNKFYGRGETKSVRTLHERVSFEG